MISTSPIVHLFLVICTISSGSAWSPSHHRRRLLVGQSCSHFVPRSALYLAKNSDKDNDLIKESTENDSSSATYGVSFIGGDPCGSKYNDDPFDATKEAAFKPGFPDDMKARIEALAAKKLEEQKNDN